MQVEFFETTQALLLRVEMGGAWEGDPDYGLIFLGPIILGDLTHGPDSTVAGTSSGSGEDEAMFTIAGPDQDQRTKEVIERLFEFYHTRAVARMQKEGGRVRR